MAAARKSGTPPPPPLSPMLRACTNLGRHIQEEADYVQMITSRGSTIAKVKKKPSYQMSLMTSYLIINLYSALFINT